MSASAANQQPTPVRIFQMLNAFQQTEALRAAIDLDVFTQLSDGPLNATALAKRIGAAPKGARVLCDYLAIAGLLNKDKDQYSLTPEAQMFLSKRSPAYVGSATQFMCSDYQLRNFSALTDAVRRGGCGLEDSSTSPENPMWVNFARGMAPLRVPAAEIHRQAGRRRSAKADEGARHRRKPWTLRHHHCEAQSQSGNRGG